jgi:SagB-type dehydrogenase family enzyme
MKKTPPKSFIVLSILELYEQKTSSQLFIESTKQGPDLVSVAPAEEPDSWKHINFKSYPRFDTFFLEEPKPLESKTLSEVLSSRTSVRTYDPYKAISLTQLSHILYYSAGIKGCFSDISDWDKTRRYYPSAGYRYPLEIYIIALNVENLAKGVYHYNVRMHALEQVRKIAHLDEMEGCFRQSWTGDATFIIVLSAVFGRTEIKYKSRGLRHIFIESGHLSQNLYLVAQEQGWGCCGLGGYNDDQVNNLLRIDGENESVVYALTFGQT